MLFRSNVENDLASKIIPPPEVAMLLRSKTENYIYIPSMIATIDNSFPIEIKSSI